MRLTTSAAINRAHRRVWKENSGKNDESNSTRDEAMPQRRGRMIGEPILFTCSLYGNPRSAIERGNHNDR